MRIEKAHRHIIHRVRALMLALALVFARFCDLPASAETDGMLRVLLTRLGAQETLIWTANCDYYLAADPSVRIAAGDEVSVTAGENGLTLSFDGQRVTPGTSAKLLRATAGDGGIRFTKPELSNRFCGDIGLSASGGVISAILNIYIEDYLRGTVGYAMPPSSSIEALKAMAIAARTTVLRRRNARGNALYDVTDTGALVFKGCSDSPDYANVDRAVNDTRGVVLYYDGALAQCEWCASNGGQTESSKNAGGSSLPYSVVKDDPADYASASAAVHTATINKDLSGIRDELRDALTAGVAAEFEARNVSGIVERFQLLAVENITACESRFPAPSRLYKSLTFRLQVKAASVRGETKTGAVSVSIPTYGGIEDWYGLSLNDGDNETVWVTESSRAFTVAFRRNGSGVGLSLRGAQVMAERGRRAWDILSFYYPGVERKHMSLRDTTAGEWHAGLMPTQAAVATGRLSERTDLLDAPEKAGIPTATMAAGAVVDIYGASGEWALVGSSGKYGYLRAERLGSVALSGEVSRASGTVYGQASDVATLMRLPFADAEELGTLSAGEVIRVLMWNDDWRTVEWRGQRAFVAAEILPLTSIETPEPTTAPPADPDAFIPAGENVRVQLRQDAPLFESPNALSSTLLTLKRGDVVTLLSYNREWARVRTKGGREGCLRLESITAIDPESADGEIEGGPIQRIKGFRYMFVTAGVAPVYAAWSVNSEVRQTLYYGERVQVGAYNSVWACVKVDGVNCYLRMDALSTQKPAAIEGGTLIRTNATAIALRDATVAASPTDPTPVVTLSEGQTVSIEAANAIWAVVRTGNAVGYVRAQYLDQQ